MPGSWRCDESKLPAASFTFDGGTHWIRPLRMWFGEVERVTGLMGSAVHHMAVSVCAFVCPVPCLLAPGTLWLAWLECNIASICCFTDSLLWPQLAHGNRLLLACRWLWL